MIKLTDKSLCCGCAACAQICPLQCIQMLQDERGFVYPNADADKCSQCGRCDSVCPYKNLETAVSPLQNVYVGQNKNSSTLRESTSGGVFSALAETVICQGGAVFGAVLDDELSVHHALVADSESLRLFRGSKYVQSSIGSCYAQARELLKEGKSVLFSGTPCQIEGLLCYLGGKSDNLFLVDLVCRAVPSPLALDKYLEFRLGAKEKRHDYYLHFRDKGLGYEYPTFVLGKQSGEEVYREGIDTDPYLRAFYSGIIIRPSCADCRFRSSNRRSDLTIWDCFDADRYPEASAIDNGKGVTHILVHTPKGGKLLKEASRSLNLFGVDAQKAIGSSKEMRLSPALNEQSPAFFEELSSKRASHVYQKFYPKTPKTRLERFARRFFHKTGLYRAAKRVFLTISGFRR